MSDNINQMNLKQLRNEVQLLRDELAIMKRKYEDIIYNLDTDNFSSRFVKEQGNMRTAIEVTAEGIKTKVSKEDFESEKTQTAEKIESVVKDMTDADKNLQSSITQEAGKIRAEVKETTDEIKTNYSTIEQTDKKISAVVKEVGENYVKNSTFEQRADEIYAEVSENYDDLSDYISTVRQTANKISTKVEKVNGGKFTTGEKDASGNDIYYTLFEQTADTFTFLGNYMDIQSAIKLLNNSKKHVFSIFHDESSNSVSGGTVYIWGSGSTPLVPIVIGSSTSSGKEPVYLYGVGESNLIATHGWVRENGGGGTAKFA
jgi:hypothetical protein